MINDWDYLVNFSKQGSVFDNFDNYTKFQNSKDIYKVEYRESSKTGRSLLHFIENGDLKYSWANASYRPEEVKHAADLLKIDIRSRV